MIATRIVATVSRVSRLSGVRVQGLRRRKAEKPGIGEVVGPLVFAAALAETAVRLLRPRAAPTEPAAVELGHYFSAEEVRRGARFARPQLAIGFVRSALDLLALAAIVRRPPRLPRQLDAHPDTGGALTAAGLVAGMTILSLPLSALSRRRAIAVGLVTQSWRGWAGDVAKSTAIEAGLAGAAGAATLTLIRRYPRAWWIPVGAGSVALGALLGALAPVLLDPIFNKFTPLPEGELRADVFALARAAGVEVGEVYAVDASRRTTGANAYVTGLGPTKRVVLFDTLIDRFSRDEVRVVVAHELSHVRHRDVVRGVAYAAIVMPAAALATQRVGWSISAERDTPAALPALALAAALVAAPIALIGNRLSRALERRADDYSLTLSDAPAAFVSFERSIALQNVADLSPPRWVSAVLATHPPTLERIGAAVSYAGRTGQPVG
jgi:STE24 endopeptidase